MLYDPQLHDLLSGGIAAPQDFGRFVQGQVDQRAAEAEFRRQREEQLREAHRALMDDIAQQAMLEQYAAPRSAFSPRELGTGTVRDFGTISKSVHLPAGDVSKMTPEQQAEFDRRYSEENPSPSLPSVFRKLEREGVIGYHDDRFKVLQRHGAELRGEVPPEPPVIEIEGTLQSRGGGVRRESTPPPPTSAPYAGMRTAEARKNAASLRERILTERGLSERAAAGQGEKAREAELRSATQLAVRAMADAAALARARVRGPPQGEDPFKWRKLQLDSAQKLFEGALQQIQAYKAQGFQEDDPRVASIVGALPTLEAEFKAQQEAVAAQGAERGAARAARPQAPEVKTVKGKDGHTYRDTGTGWEQVD